MAPVWCENIKIVQDELTFLPSAAFNAHVVVGSLGCLILFISLFYMKSDKGIWFGFFMIVLSVFGFGRLSTNTKGATDIFMSDQKVEFIGEVSDLEVEIEFNRNNGVSPYSGTSGPIRFDEIKSKNFFGTFETITPITARHGFTINRLSPSRFDTVWFKVRGQLFQSEVGDVGINLGNECDGRRCGLRADDRVRVSVNRDSIKKRPHNSKFEDYYSTILRIERCDDAHTTTSSG